MDYSLSAAFIGFVVGGLVSLTGIGGGVLLLPMLILGLRVPPIVAVGSDATFMFLTKLGAAILHWRQGHVDWRLAMTMALGSVPGALVGLGILVSLRSHYGEGVNDILRPLIGVLLVVIPLLMLVQNRVEGYRGALLRNHLPGWVNRYNGAIFTGLIGGVLVGLTSVGSGSVIMMLLLLFYHRPPAVLVGTDIFHAVILTGVTGLAHLGLGTVDVGLVGWLLVGSVPGVVLGSRLTVLVPAVRLRQGLLILLFTTGIIML
jgi:uncharacterized membrane protein YfcA